MFPPDTSLPTPGPSCERSADAAPLRSAARIALVAWGLSLTAGFALAASLEPDPRGFGTHERLGLPPCTFRTIWGIPCPSCGMTTSFANFTRGRFVEAARANLAGLLLAVLCAALIPWCLVSAWRGRPWGIVHPVRALTWALGLPTAVALAAWAVRLSF